MVPVNLGRVQLQALSETSNFLPTSMSESPDNAGALISNLESLRIPSEYKRYPDLEDNDILTTWREEAEQNLLELKAIVNATTKDGGSTLSQNQKAAVVAAVAQFDGGPWVSSTSKGVATGESTTQCS